MKKTLFITNDFPPKKGGVANYLANLCNNLPKDKVVVLAPSFPCNEFYDCKINYKIYRFIEKKCCKVFPYWVKLIFEAKKIIKQEKVEQVFCGQPLPNGTIGLILNKFLKIPFVLSFHGMDILVGQKKWRKRILLRKIIKKAKTIITNSNFTKNKVSQFYKIPKKISVIYPTSNLEFEENINIQDIATRYNLNGKKVILSVGRLELRKGFDMMISAMPQILKKVPNAIYLIIGTGKEKEYLSNLIDKLNLKNKVLILENISNDNLKKFFLACDVFSNPSRNIKGDVEGFGIVYLEANLAGKPVVAGKFGGENEAVINSKTGFLVNSKNINEIEEKVTALLLDEKMAQKMGELGKERALREFNIKKQAKLLEELLA